MKNNKAAQRKAVMRLCAFAMLSDDYIAKTEEDVILEIIKDRRYNADTDVKEFFDDCKNCLINEDSIQRSIFVNIDSLDKHQICNELNDIVKVAKADNALLDAEREGFVLICKLFKLKQSRTLWKKALEKNLDIKDISQKPLMPLEDYRSIKKIIDFYNINGPIVKGTRHVLQMEYTRRNDLENYREHLITRKAFLLFCFVAFLLFIRFPILDVVNELDVLTDFITKSDVYPYLKLGITSLIALFVIGIVTTISLRKRKKKSSSEITKSLNSITWWVFGIALLSGFIYHEIWTLAMMISIEWLIFMREKHRSEGHNHTVMLIVLVLLAIIADIALSITECISHDEILNLKILSAPIFLGCICFFFGKWLENDNIKTQDELKEMEGTVLLLEKTKV